MTVLDHSSHLSFDDIGSPLSQEQAQRLAKQIISGCDLCLWELHSHSIPCKVLVNVVSHSSLETTVSCPSADVLISFATLSLEGNRLVEVAAHVANCSKCYSILFSEGGVAEKALAYLQENADRATTKAIVQYKEHSVENEQLLLVILNSEGVPLYDFPYEPNQRTPRLTPRRESLIDSEALEWLINNSSWSLQIIDQRSHTVFIELESPTEYLPVAPSEEATLAERFVSGVLTATSHDNSTIPIASTADLCHPINLSKDSSVTGFYHKDALGAKWSFEIDNSGTSISLTIELPNE